MTDASFVVVGWLGTAGAVAAYALSVRLRTRRARAGARIR